MSVEDTKQRKQTFVASHLDEFSFKADGHRPYYDYRELGMVEATQGALRAHVLRANSPCKEGGVGWHKHILDVHFVYVLKGWQKMEFEGQGVVTMREGSAWIQPPSILHTVLEWSEDFEALEIMLPADYDTIDGR